MNRNAHLTLIFAAAIFMPLHAQNEVRHLDQVAFADHGGVPHAASATLLQRIPADQAVGRQAVTGFTTTLQCQGSTTAQLFFYELRSNNPAGPATGAPATTAGAIATAGPFTFPAIPTPIAFEVTITFSTPIQLLPVPPRVPAADLYSAVVLPAPVPGNATMLMHMSANEPMRANAVGYTGTQGVAGLAWSVVTGLGNPAVMPLNAAWALGTRFANDVCQPFARRGARDNFGYAGLYPHTAGGDAPGWRVRATAGVGSPSLLLLSAGLLATPTPIPGVGGLLCIEPATSFLAAVATTARGTGLPTGTTQAAFGPFPANLAGAQVYAQALTVDLATTLPRLSTACRVDL